MKSLMAPIWGVSCVEYDNASRTSRDTRWRYVWLNRSLGVGFPS